MRYDSVRKSHRNELLCEYKRGHPEMSWAEIAKPFGITRQRAQAIFRTSEMARIRGKR